jgi:hypothetical protein
VAQRKRRPRRARPGDPRLQLVSVLLPVYDNSKRAFPRGLFQQVASELTAQFGGLTAHTRAPAQGLWQPEDPAARPDGSSATHHDDIVIFEVMVESLDRAWWASYRRSLEERFGQEEIVIRAQAIDVL